MKKISIKNILIIVLCFALISMSVGFIVLSIKLEALKNNGNIFNVKFSNIKQINSVKGGINNPKGTIDILKNGKILDLNFELFSDRDEIDYEITIKNEGTIDAEISDLLMSPDYTDEFKDQITPINIVLSDISGKVLEPDEEIVVKLSVLCNGKSDKKIPKIGAKIGLLTSSK